ncbi:polysaccharide lyase family 8 super-sandwich domain-containing protein [Paenibacillus sp. FSL K6-2862]|uniref:polysaccharide lyase family 8 super-sandwich domain-containing protein n=1 Tax=Paenibacillus sp. FSL K6-2862 TaxID=2921484 RepID=UPI0030F9EECB
MDENNIKLVNGPRTNKVMATADWSYREIYLNPPANSAQVVIEPFFETGTGTAWIDDIRLVSWSGITDLSIDRQYISLEEGDSVQLQPIILPDTVTDRTVEWTTSDESVVSVADGLVKGVGIGTAIIRVSTSGDEYTAESHIRVEAPGTMQAFAEARQKWRDRLTGGDDVDFNDAVVKEALETLVTTVKGYRDTLSREDSRTYLWSDRASSTDPYHSLYSYSRLKDLALAYSIKGSELYGSESLRDDIVDGIDWMYKNRYNENSLLGGNWFVSEIAIPQTLGDLLILMYDDLPADIRNNSIRAIDAYIPDPTRRVSLISNPTFREKGANLLDKAFAVTLRGIVGQSGEKIEQGIEHIGAEFAYVDSGEGVYRDGSIVQHTDVAYNGNYGVSWLSRAADLIYLLEGTPWPITDPLAMNVYDWVTQSFEPFIYDGIMMDMVRGRQVAAGNGSAKNVIMTILRLADAAPPDKAMQMRSMVKEWIQIDIGIGYREGLSLYELRLLQDLLRDEAISPRGKLIRHQVFSGMDRVVHLREAFGFGLSMFSDRISAFEFGNTENPRGWYTGTGMTYLYNKDYSQYWDYYWPTVDAYRLPGTTTDGSGKDMAPVEWKSYRNTKDWVGGSSIDGLYGAAGMDFSLEQVTGSALSGKKSWFSFDDEVVALGAGITGLNDNKVETIVENRKLNSAGDNKLVVDGVQHPGEVGWSAKLGEVDWAHLEGNVAGADVGYYFPESVDLEGLREARTGSYYDINPRTGSTNQETRQYLSLAIDHGRQPKSAGYAYVLLPGKSANDTAEYASAPDIQVLANNTEVQAVSDMKLGLTAANFWEADTIGKITVHQPASVLMRNVDGLISLAVSDPTQKQAEIRLELDVDTDEVLQANGTVTIEQTSPKLIIKVATAGTSGASHTLKVRIASEKPNPNPIPKPTPTPNPSAQTWRDINGHWAADAILTAAQSNLVKGYEDGTFRPNKKVTRAQFIVMLARALGLDRQASGSDTVFVDQASIADWAKDSVANLANAGVLNGYEDGTFGPERWITRAEMLVLLSRAISLGLPDQERLTEFVDGDQVPEWGANAVSAAVSSGVIRGRNGARLAPADHTSRAEAVVVLLRALELRGK